MKNTKEKKIKSENPFFSVLISTFDKKLVSWNFILKAEKEIIFAGKTIIENKQKSNSLIKASQLKTKALFYIETNFSYPSTGCTYLPETFKVSSMVEVRNYSIKPNKSILSWFSNIAPLLLAIENNDSLLAAEIFHKNSSIFMQFPTTIIKLLEPISIEGLFSWVWGRFDKKAQQELESIFEGKCTKAFEKWGVAETFFTASRRRLDIQVGTNESIEQCITRYLKTHPGTKLTLGIVGTNHYRWVEKNLSITENKNIRNNFFSNTKTLIKAETSNEFDKNALAMYVANEPASENENISGYIRKTGAELLRKAHPNKLQFSSRLARLGSLQGGTTGMVVEITI